MNANRAFDCVVCGSCVADLLVRPVPLEVPIGAGKLLNAEPIQITTGGIVCNAGIAMSKLGMKAAAFSYVGCDEFGRLIRQSLDHQGVDTHRLEAHPSAGTSTTAVLIDPSGERSFAHALGAPRLLDKAHFLKHLDLFAQSRMMLIGYYSLMPQLEDDLPELLAAVRHVGCKTAMDAAGSGGAMQPLEKILPHLDVYVPSRDEAEHQTAESDPRRIIDAFRSCNPAALLGVKLGSDGAMLSPSAGVYLEIPAVTPPGPVVDTTGAGDAYYAGLLTGLLRGLSAEHAGRLAAAAGACCVTGYGATAGLRDWMQTMQLARLTLA